MKLARPLAALLVVIVALVCVRLVGERAGAPERDRPDASGAAEQSAQNRDEGELAAQPTGEAGARVATEINGTHLVVVDDTGAPVDDARVRWVTTDSAATVGEGAALPSAGRYLVLVERDGLVPRADFVAAEGATRFVLLRGARIELRLVGDLPDPTRFEARLERARATDAPSDDDFLYGDLAPIRRQLVEQAIDGAANAMERVTARRQLEVDGPIGSVAVFERQPSTEGRALVWTALDAGSYRYRVESPAIEDETAPVPQHADYLRPYSAAIVARSGDTFTFDVLGRAPARITGRFVVPDLSATVGSPPPPLAINLMLRFGSRWIQSAAVNSPDGAFDFRVDDPSDHAVTAMLSVSSDAWLLATTALALAPGEWRDLGDVLPTMTDTTLHVVAVDLEGVTLETRDVFKDPERALLLEYHTWLNGAPLYVELPLDATREYRLHGPPRTEASAKVRLRESNVVAPPFALLAPPSAVGLASNEVSDLVADTDVTITFELFRPGVDRALASRLRVARTLRSCDWTPLRVLCTARPFGFQLAPIALRVMAVATSTALGSEWSCSQLKAAEADMKLPCRTSCHVQHSYG